MVRGDQAKVTVLVRVPPADAFRIFTEEIDAWWRAGLKYRLGRGRSVLHLEPRLGGRLLQTDGATVFETGRVTAWDPPARVVLDWRISNFAANEKTEVEVLFEPTRSGTNVTVIHRGWADLRPDHPSRHGEEPGAFTRSLGAWWGELLTAYRMRAD